MSKINIYQVDAFTDKLYCGNPAAVCVLEDALSESTMQSIAAENNLAETAFILSKDTGYEIRWFTPEVEVDLCGHATLASAYVIFNQLHYKEKEIIFYSLQSGILKVTKDGDLLTLDFPADNLTEANNIEEVKNAIGIEPIALYQGKTKLLAIINSEEEVKNLKPDMAKVKAIKSMGIIVSAQGNKVDFVSRFFVPQVGIDEDPVTGSAHTTLTTYWSKELNKSTLSALQLSRRGGVLTCTMAGDRVLISGTAKLYLIGEIFVE